LLAAIETRLQRREIGSLGNICLYRHRARANAAARSTLILASTIVLWFD
jgi:hypothetical protein